MGEVLKLRDAGKGRTARRERAMAERRRSDIVKVVPAIA